MPGVHAIWTAGDVADIPPIEFRATKYTGLEPYRQPVLATGRVRYVGEPVAIVFAEDGYTAEDAAALVRADIDEEHAHYRRNSGAGGVEQTITIPKRRLLKRDMAI